MVVGAAGRAGGATAGGTGPGGGAREKVLLRRVPEWEVAVGGRSDLVAVLVEGGVSGDMHDPGVVHGADLVIGGGGSVDHTVVLGPGLLPRHRCVELAAEAQASVAECAGVAAAGWGVGGGQSGHHRLGAQALGKPA